MPGRVLLSAAIALVAVLCVTSSAAAESQTADAYRFMLADHTSPPPLVPTSLPSSIGSFADAGARFTPKRGTWNLSFIRLAGKRVDANLIINNVTGSSLSKTKRKLRKLYRARKTKVRGRPGLAFKRRKGSGKFLAWIEDGSLYEVATATPKKVSDGDLNAVAAGLEHLRGSVFGQLADSLNSYDLSPVIYLTDGHALVGLHWSAPCIAPGDSIGFVNPTSEATSMTALNAGNFSVGPSVVPAYRPGPDEPSTWTVSASGTASTAGGQLTMQVSAGVGNLTCSAGPSAVNLQPSRFP